MKVVVLAFAILSLFNISCAQQPMITDLVIYNAKIYTVNDAQPWAEALAVKDGIIQFVGSNADVQSYIGNNTNVVDLEGLLVMPGMQDAHLHAIEAGMNEAICEFPLEESFATYERLAKRCVADWEDGDWVLGDWVLGAGAYAGGLIESIELEGELPIDVLDRASPEKPMLILDAYGHGAWANTLALKAVGYDKLREQPQGGLVHRDEASGRLSGVVFENAYQNLQDVAWKAGLLSRWKTEASETGLKVALEQLAENGLTSVSDAGGYWPRGHVGIWQNLEKKNELTVRASNALYVYPDKDFDKQLRELKKYFSNNPDALLRFNQAKLYVDGILSYGTSALYEPYTNTPASPLSAPLGYNYFQQKILERYVIELDALGFQLHFHATGDRGVGQVLDAIGAARAVNGTTDRRHRITHLYQVAPADILRFKELGVVADFQIGEQNAGRESVGFMRGIIGERVERLLPIREFLDAGVMTTLSTDWDAEPLSPFESLEASLTRNGQTVPDLATAVKLKTINTAYLLHQEDKTGSLEVGKFADLIVLDRNIFEIRQRNLHKTLVIATLLEGEAVFDPEFVFEVE